MKFCRYLLAVALFSILSLFTSTRSEAQRITYQVREIASGFNVPWEMRIAPDGWLFFTERPGRISKLHPETGETKLLLRADDCVLWHEAGMLGFDLHPNFPDSPYLYVAYVYKEADNSAKYGIFRFTYSGDTLNNRIQLFGPATANFAHNGSRVVIREGKIYFSNGEIDQKEIAQDVSRPHGKINRINLDGSIPEDNPFPGYATWSYGHRNPQGLDFGPTGILYSSEHGDYTDDEINLIERGRNYGWPRATGFCDSTDQASCEELNVREPLAAFTPTLAASDLTYFDHETFPEWRHSILMASLRDQSLHQFSLSEDGKKTLSWERYNLLDYQGELCGRLRAICLSKDGRVYLSTGNSYAKADSSDKIFELIRTGIEPAAMTLLLPQNDDVIAGLEHTFTWKQPFIGASYEMQIATSTEFDSLSIVYRTELQDSAITINSLTPGIRYFWRVRESKTNGEWSEVRTFIEEKSGVAAGHKVAKLSLGLRVQAGSIILNSEADPLSAVVEVYDAVGRKELSALIDDLAPHSERSLGHFGRGVYFVRIAAGRAVETRQVIVQ